MKQSDLISAVAAATGLSKNLAEVSIKETFRAIAEAARRGDDVTLQGFGSFKVKRRAARTGKNPGTGAPLEIAESRALTFKQSSAIKTALNG